MTGLKIPPEATVSWSSVRIPRETPFGIMACAVLQVEFNKLVFQQLGDDNAQDLFMNMETGEIVRLWV